MFQQELYVASTSDNKIYVADTLNCKLRLVNPMPTPSKN
jgi:hypothetical protein